MPCRIPDAALIPIARFGTSNRGRLKHIYRVGLEHRYGKMMQTLAGIHYNFSLPDEFWETFQELQENRETLPEFSFRLVFQDDSQFSSSFLAAPLPLRRLTCAL